MPINFTNRQLEPHLVWMGDRDRGLLVDTVRWKVVGYLWHDGEGAWTSWVWLPIWRGWKAARGRFGVREWYVCNLLSACVPLRCRSSVREASAQIEKLAGSAVLPPDWEWLDRHR